MSVGCVECFWKVGIVVMCVVVISVLVKCWGGWEGCMCVSLVCVGVGIIWCGGGGVWSCDGVVLCV